MKHTVIKLGGSALRDPCYSRAVLEILDGYRGPIVVVATAIEGVTERLVDSISTTGGREALVGELREEYRCLAKAFEAPFEAAAAARMQIERILRGLELLFARGDLARGGESDRLFKARVLATGDRLAATCVSLALVSIGKPAPVIEPGRLGLVARPVSAEEAVVDVAAAAPRIRASVSEGRSAVVPGGYGVAEDGSPWLFGRGGSDYSAAVIAACLGAASCDLIKDDDGLQTADPALVEGTRLVVELSYEEAEALARGGARILHPSCIAPLREARVPLRLLGRSPRVLTSVDDSRPGGRGPRAVALGRGPAGSAEITVAGRGSVSRSAATVLKAFEARGFQARAFFSGSEGASFRVLVEAARGKEALRVAHEALFG